MKKVKEFINKTIELIVWIKNKKLIQEELKNETRTVDIQKAEISRLNKKIKKMEDEK